MAIPTIPEIRSRILNALADEIGTYTYTDANGATDVSAAIKIENHISPGGFYGEPKVSGLEVVIEPEIASPGYSARLGGDFVCAHRHRITLKQWDSSADTKTARSLMLREFTNLFDSPPVRIIRNATVDSIEQLIFSFTLPVSS